ncbi:hypothetical protein [Streptomyces sp. NPDC049887]|uniref:hypothetical protein n=1 Tax=unclassified Streptomyces TaxID=2593676 RepID=UPI0034338ECA
MGSGQRRRSSVRNRAQTLGLGGERGDYAVAGVPGALGQLLRRSLVLLCVVLVGYAIVARPEWGFLKGVGTAIAVALALCGLNLTWRLLSARFGLRRCYVHEQGLVVTNTLGGVRHAVAWSEVTGLAWMSNLTLLFAFHRFEIERRGARRMAFVALGANPALAAALLQQAEENGVVPC